MSIPSFSEDAIRLGPWSVSKLQCGEGCHLQFYLQYIKKRKDKTGQLSSKARIGSAVHAMVEDKIRGADLKRSMKYVIPKFSLTSVEVEETLGYYHNVLSFADRLETYKEKHGIDVQEVEKRFAFDHTFVPAPFFEDKKDPYKPKPLVRGVWDLYMRVGSTIIILDHKTGDVNDVQEALEKYDAQRRFYVIGALIAHPEAERIKTGFHYVMSEEIFFNEWDTAKTIREYYMPWLVEKINKVASDVLRSTSPTKSWRCNFCDFKHLCPLQNTTM